LSGWLKAEAAEFCFAAIAASRTEVFGSWCPVKAVNDSLSIAVK
jgi:hypothetical protein